MLLRLFILRPGHCLLLPLACMHIEGAVACDQCKQEFTSLPPSSVSIPSARRLRLALLPPLLALLGRRSSEEASLPPSCIGTDLPSSRALHILAIKAVAREPLLEEQEQCGHQNN